MQKTNASDEAASAGFAARCRLGWLNKVERRLVMAIAVLAAGVLLFGAITQDVLDNDGITRSDSRFLHDFLGPRSGGFTVGLAKGVTFLGTGWAVYSLLAMLGFAVWRRTHRLTLPLFCIVWLTLGQAVRLGISRAVARPRPPQSLHLASASGFAFPSGHTASATVGYGLAAGLLLTLGVTHRRLVVAAAVILAVGVGLSRVYLGVHWPSDVMGGWTFGITWLAIAAVVVILARLIRAHGRRLRQ